MTREYIRVTPSRSDLAPQTVIQQLIGLHGIERKPDGVLARLNPLVTSSPPTFEFLAISEGEDEPVEFYYGVDDRLDALEERLRTLYPAAFTIDRVELDLRVKLLPAVESDREEEGGRDVGQFPESDDGPPSESEEGSPRQSMTGTRLGTEGAVIDGESGGREFGFESDEEVFNTETGVDVAPAPNRTEGVASGSTRVRADPDLDGVDPMGVTWYGSGSRREDWMTTLSQFTGREAAEAEHSRGSLAPLIDQLTQAEHPIGFQVLFRRKPDWSPRARERKRKLRAGEDRLIDEVFGRMLGNSDGEEHSPSKTGRQHQFLDISGRERVESIDKKEPQHTFTVNLRALTLAGEKTDKERLAHRLEDVGTVFDHLNGAHYRLTSKRFRRGLRKNARACRRCDRVLDREFSTGRWRKTRPDLVLGPEELAHFVVVPPSTELTTEGGRGSEANPENRNPLPRPHSGLMEMFREGLAIGRALDETGTPENEPTCIPPHLLPFHVGRFAKTGGGKSVALINDALSLYEQTDGPVFLIDSKGGNLPEYYMKAHAKRFGVEDLEENIVHFSVPEILPGFAFFDIRPALENGVRRVDAVQAKADHYEEIVKLVMGPERYEEAVASPNVIKYLIKAMYDEEHGLENGHFREDVDYFSHDQLENAVTQFHAAGPPDPAPEEAPQSSDPRVAEKLERHLYSNSTMFANVVSGVSNRMDYITQDAHLRRIFNNTESRFDFRELLDEHQVVIFDLGELRDEAAKVMTGVILTSLYDAVKSRDPDELARKSEEYVANLLIDEAGSVVVSDTLTTLLEKGREFQLSVELVTQFPEQMLEAGDREVYLNVLNNIGSPLIGKIVLEEDIAEALAHEEVDPVEFKNRISSLPRGEWIAQLPTPEFGETGPEPFSLEPLPIPAGHPESDQPLTEREEARFQEALDTVHERTQETFGVPEWDGSLSRDATGDVAVEDADDRPLEVVMAEAIRAVQLREDIRERNGWVPVEKVDEEVLNRIDETDIESRGYEALPEVREASRFIEVDLHPERDTVVTRLTGEGETAAEPDTGEGPFAGGEDHDEALLMIEDALTALDFTVTIQDQSGEEKPDAIATHPEIDPRFSIEAETTTHNRPAKVLANLKKAQESGRVPVFVVGATDEEASGIDLARRIGNILAEPVRQLASGETRLYTRDDPIRFNGGAGADGGLVAVRPATGGSRQTQWIRRDDRLVLRDEDGTDHAVVADLDTASKDQFPATYSYDESTGAYTVIKPGELPETYESREAFEADWVPIRRPFIPESDLPVPEYTSESYVIVVLSPEETDRDAVVFDLEEETARPLETLVEDAKTEVLHPAQPSGSQPVGEGADTHVSSEQPGHEDERESPSPGSADEGFGGDREPDDGGEDTTTDAASAGIPAFVADHLVEDEESVIAVGDVYEAYEAYVAEHGFAVRPRNRFTRELKEHIGFERDRKWLDGKSQRCYIGIDLVESEASGDGNGHGTASES